MANKQVAEWDPDAVIATVGDTLLTDFAPETFITAEQGTPDITLTKAVSGMSTLNKAYDRSMTISFVLTRASPANDKLRDQWLSGREQDAVSLYDLQIKDPKGSGLIGGRAFFTGPPPWNAAPESPSFTWSLVITQADYAPGSLGQV